MRKEGARLELTEPLVRPSVKLPRRRKGFIAGVVHDQKLDWVGAFVGGRNRCRGGSALPCQDSLYRVLRRSREQVTCPWVSRMEGELC